MQGEDDFRKPDEQGEATWAQIMIGLLVDQFGFPLGLHSFKGNTAETTTILPVIDTLKSCTASRILRLWLTPRCLAVKIWQN